MAKSYIYGPNPADDFLPRAETGVFPERLAATEPARRPYVDPPAATEAPVATVEPPQDAAEPIPPPCLAPTESWREYIQRLKDTINRLAADGEIRLELDGKGKGEHARLVVLLPKQQVTWEPLE